MSSVDADVERARATEAAVEAAKEEVRKRFPQEVAGKPDGILWHLAAGDLLVATATPVDLTTLLSSPPQHALRQVSGSLGDEPVTAAVLDGYAVEASGAQAYVPGSEWDHLEEKPGPGICWCGDFIELDYYQCLNCGHFGHDGDPPVNVVENSEGLVVPVYEDQRYDRAELACQKCQSSRIDCSFNTFCSGCQHRMSKF